MREQQRGKTREWHFDRYRDGILKAQGAVVNADSLEEALEKAKRLFSYNRRDSFRLRAIDQMITEVPCESLH